MAQVEQIRVYAVPGEGHVQDMQRGRPHYVGYELVTDAQALADHVVPGGNRYRIKPDGVLVPNDSYHRGALRDGSLSLEPVAKAAEASEDDADDVDESEA